MKQIAIIALLALFLLGAYIGVRALPPEFKQMIVPQINFGPEEASPSASTTITSGVAAKASFKIYTNAFEREFDNPIYHKKSELAYITAENPAVIIVKQPYTSWRTFFDTMPFKLSTICLVTGTQQTFCNSEYKELVFYLNGQKVTDLFDRTIHDGDKLLVSFGDKNDEGRIQKELRTVPNPY